MRLKWTGTEAETWDESKLPAIYGAPSSSAQKVGTIGARAIVASPLHVENGFAEVLRLDGKKGWIKVDLLLPYPKSADPSKTCVPSYMSDGGIGFGTVKN